MSVAPDVETGAVRQGSRLGMALTHRFSSLFSVRAKLAQGIKLLENGQPLKGFSILSTLAKQGNVEAQYRVGRCYLEALGAPASLEEGARWLRRAADAGKTEACFILATLYAMGMPEGFEVRKEEEVLDLSARVAPAERRADFYQARHWASIAAEAGSADAQALLGYILTNGPEDIRDQVEARQWYERSAEAGCSQGHLGMGLVILRDAETAEDQAKAAVHFQEATKGGLGTAFSILGRMSETGSGIPRDLGRAAEYYRQAAERNIVPAQARYGIMLLEGQGIERNAGRAETWLRRAALGGDSESAALLGDIYANGGDLPPNLIEAVKWYRFAAEQKHGPAARALALLYLTGSGTQRDPDVAAHWFAVAAEAGDRSADADFGNLLLTGAKATETERESLRQRFERSAEKGELPGAFNLGVCLRSEDRRAG